MTLFVLSALILGQAHRVAFSGNLVSKSVADLPNLHKFGLSSRDSAGVAGLFNLQGVSIYVLHRLEVVNLRLAVTQHGQYLSLNLRQRIFRKDTLLDLQVSTITYVIGQCLSPLGLLAQFKFFVVKVEDMFKGTSKFWQLYLLDAAFHLLRK